ncbi:MAG TPA: YfaP family protein [Candidatus Poseidoniaceae archaeon]|nr:YfaP family protein [Candidatus Poseidoniaceae archaeon]
MDQNILLGIIIGGGSALFFLILFLINRFRKQRERKQQLRLQNASRAPLSSMRSQRSDRRNKRRHVVSRGLQLNQLSDTAQQAYQQRQQRRVSQYSDLQLVMDEIFIPGRDAVELEDDEEDDVEDRSTWIAENEDNLNAHADLVAEEEVGTGISVRVTEEEDRELMERLAREGGKSGVVQISLAWDDYNDLDMHVFCPSGERIYFNNRKSACGGELDVDMNVRPKSKKPIENVVWTNEAPDGEYKIGVHFYRHHRKRRTKKTCQFRLRVVTYGQAKEYSGELTHGDPMSMITSFILIKPDEEE